MRQLSLATTILAFIVILFGAYVRLSDAGLGCPDWPGCYGHLTVPNNEMAGTAVEAPKAWKEMIHRYLASTLGMMIVILAITCTIKKSFYFIPWFLVGLVILQGLLGMWTVTLKLHPLVVMAHLLGGFSTLSLLWWLYLKIRNPKSEIRKLDPIILIALLLLIGQIALGGWTSANYASLACPDFPTCQSKLFPTLDIKAAFGVWHDFGINYEGGVLHNKARVTIHWMHRLGAFINFFMIGMLGVKSLRNTLGQIKKIGAVLLLLLITQISLGISNVLFLLPLPIAVAHNGTAALLLLCLLTLISASKHQQN